MERTAFTKRTAFALALTIGIAALLAAGATALFTAKGTSQGIVSTGNVRMELHDKTATENGLVDFPEAALPVMPGDVVSKVVAIENTGDHPLFARVLVETNAPEGLPADGALQLNVDERHWKLADDGYYYYHRALQSGEETEPLFTEVSIDPDRVDNAFMDKELTIALTAHAVQSENNGQAPADAVGWPR